VLALFGSREEQAIVELALRQQLMIYAQDRPRRLSPLDRTFWVVLSRLWPRWKEHLVVVRPETVVRWHRDGFRRYWRSISTPGPGRPPIPEETKALIVRMATENRWRARKSQAELMKLGIRERATFPVEIQVHHPPINGQRVSRWKAVAQGGVELYTGWRFQHRCQLLPGAWLFEVYHNGKILAAKELMITVAPGQQGTDGCPEP